MVVGTILSRFKAKATKVLMKGNKKCTGKATKDLKEGQQRF